MAHGQALVAIVSGFSAGPGLAGTLFVVFLITTLTNSFHRERATCTYVCILSGGCVLRTRRCSPKRLHMCIPLVEVTELRPRRPGIARDSQTDRLRCCSEANGHACVHTHTDRVYARTTTKTQPTLHFARRYTPAVQPSAVNKIRSIFSCCVAACCQAIAGSWMRSAPSCATPCVLTGRATSARGRQCASFNGRRGRCAA